MVINYEDIARHLGHEISVAIYGGDRNAAIECETCYEVLVDYDNVSNSQKYRVSLTEKIKRDWVVEVEAASAEEAEAIASERFADLGSESGERESEIWVDWSEEIKEEQ